MLALGESVVGKSYTCSGQNIKKKKSFVLLFFFYFVENKEKLNPPNSRKNPKKYVFLENTV